jgi:hypothetical protein
MLYGVLKVGVAVTMVVGVGIGKPDVLDMIQSSSRFGGKVE